MPDPQWSAFLGVTAVVVTLFLGLARLSQGVVRDRDGRGSGERARDDDGRARDDRRARGDDATPSNGAVDSPATDPQSVDSGAVEPAPAGESTDPPEAPAAPESTDTPPGAGDDSPPVEQGDDSPPVEVSTRPGAAETGATAREVTAGVNPDPDDAPTAARERERAERGAGPAQVRAHVRESGGELSISPGALLANVALTQGVFGGLVVAAAVYFAIPRDALGLAAEPSASGLPAVAVGVAFGVALWLGNELASAVADAAGVAYDERLREMLAPDTAGGWALLFGATLPIIAGVEEVLFRAAIVGVPAAAYGTSPWALAVVASLAFALGHGAQGRVGMVVTGTLGFALAAGFVVTGSLVVVVVAHYLVNALEFGVHEGLGVERPLGWLD